MWLKFRQVHATQLHDAAECEYNQNIPDRSRDLTGNVNKTEGIIKESAYKRSVLTNGVLIKIFVRRSGRLVY